MYPNKRQVSHIDASMDIGREINTRNFAKMSVADAETRKNSFPIEVSGDALARLSKGKLGDFRLKKETAPAKKFDRATGPKPTNI
jgi:hypothetical protein